MAKFLNKSQILDFFIQALVFIYNKTQYNFFEKAIKIIKTIKADVVYIIEEQNWAIEWDARYITEKLKKLNLVNAEIGSYKFSRKKIIHFGDIFCYILNDKLIKVHKSNKVVLTWFHIVSGDKRIKYIPYINSHVDLIHTASNLIKDQLISLGLNKSKLVIIPTGVDIKRFIKFDNKYRIKLKKKFNLPLNKFIIGSFVKDGQGWGDGIEPKLIKGPDILCEVLKKLHNEFDFHVFITGPSRGYVKKKLREYNIPFTYVYLKDYFDMVECYNALDLYLITSRVEGGPKGLLEAMASGVSVVSTNVGWASEAIEHGFNGFIAEVENIGELYNYIKKLIENNELRELFVKRSLERVKDYDWECVSKNYYHKIYKQLLDENL